MKQSSPPLVLVENVSKSYERGRVLALDRVDLEVARGEFVAVSGPSGSGKTTLLYLLGAMDTPTSGKISIDGEPLTSDRSLERTRAQKIGFVFQFHNLIPVLNAVENVEVVMLPRGHSRRERSRRALELLDLVGMARFARTNVRRLSGGERQRVAIARALANNPLLILADEPTGNLDSVNGANVLRVLNEARERSGAALVLVTHNLELCAGAAQRIVLRDGRIEQPAV